MKPSFAEERALWAQGYVRLAGVDEAGRGPLAGPVVAGAVVLPVNFRADWLKMVADSKLLTATRRDLLFEKLNSDGIGIGVGVVDSRTVDMVGIARATRLAMKAAVSQVDPAPDFLLIDYFRLPEVRLPQKGVVEGDTVCMSVACASIIAKVTRDRLMNDFDRRYPGYGFAGNKGYGTAEHLESLRRLGACPIHRRSFQPVREVCGEEA